MMTTENGTTPSGITEVFWLEVMVLAEIYSDIFLAEYLDVPIPFVLAVLPGNLEK